MRTNGDNEVVSDFEKYMYIVPMKINKMCPALIADEDFLQDCYLDFLEYTLRSEAFNDSENRSRKVGYAHNHIAQFISRKIEKLNNDNEISSGLLSINKSFSDIERIVFQNHLSEIMDELLSMLTAREKDVLESIYYYGMSHDQIGTKYGVSKWRIRQIENKSIKKLRYPSRAKKIRDFYI